MSKRRRTSRAKQKGNSLRRRAFESHKAYAKLVNRDFDVQKTKCLCPACIAVRARAEAKRERRAARHREVPHGEEASGTPVGEAQ